MHYQKICLLIVILLVLLQATACNLGADGGATETGNPAFGGTHTGNPENGSQGDGSSYKVEPRELTVTTFSASGMLAIQASSKFLTLGDALSPSQVTVDIKRNGLTKRTLGAADFAPGTTAFKVEFPGQADDIVEVTVRVTDAVMESQSLWAQAASDSTVTPQKTVDTPPPANPVLEIIDALCARISGCASASVFTTCEDSVSQVVGLPVYFGMLDPSLTFDMMMGGGGHSVGYAGSSMASDACKTALAALSCDQIAQGYQPSDPTNYTQISRTVPTDPSACGATFEEMAVQPTSSGAISDSAASPTGK